jgi:hypothetical protein
MDGLPVKKISRLSQVAVDRNCEFRDAYPLQVLQVKCDIVFLALQSQVLSVPSDNFVGSAFAPFKTLSP